MSSQEDRDPRWPDIPICPNALRIETSPLFSKCCMNKAHWENPAVVIVMHDGAVHGRCAECVHVNAMQAKEEQWTVLQDLRRKPVDLRKVLFP